MVSSVTKCFLGTALVLLAFGTLSAASDDSPMCPPERYSKVLFNQTIGGQYVEYDVDVPDLTGFTLHYWVQVLQPRSLMPIFSYLAGGAEAKDYLQVTLLKIGDTWYSVLQIKGVVVSNTKLPEELEGSWHHLLHSWDAKYGTWSVFFDGELIEAGNNSRSQDLTVKGGGRAFTGQQANTIINSFSNHCHDLGKFQEGFFGWMTLLAFDTRGMENPRSWVNRMAVSVVEAGCRAEHKGDVISWLDTPRRAYCGVTDVRAQSVCRAF